MYIDLCAFIKIKEKSKDTTYSDSVMLILQEYFYGK